jgi:citrate lyase subunit beta-like protein
LVFGAEDFTADMGAARTAQALELLYARSRLVMYAAAFGLQAIDLVTVNYKDMEVLEREALQGAQLGYSGKQLIHPLQIEPVQRIFTPSEKEVAAAAHILEEAKRFAGMGKGAFTVDGQMVDRPVIKRAESILARAAQRKG